VQNDINSDLVFSTTYDATANSQATSPLAGLSFDIYQTIELGDTQLKDIISKYTIQQIGNEVRAVKVSTGGYYNKGALNYGV
jgi:hypothetical protein